jgi:pimeloyl-ACP methyl ester carboxylesterase/UDP:flavonoid glycosyltransferase YjiC (YdhE family)
VDARARTPDQTGYAEHGGNKVYYEVFGAGEPTVVLVHGLPVAHSRTWKANIPVLARNNRVVSLDLLGNGLSDRPHDPSAYALPNTYATVQAVLAATGTTRRIVIGVSLGAFLALMDAAFNPDDVAGVVLMAPSVPVAEPPADWDGFDITRFDEPRDESNRWGVVRRELLRTDYPGFVDFFMGEVAPEPFTKSIQSDFRGYARETDGEVIQACFGGLGGATPMSWQERVERTRPLVEMVHTPALVMHGTDDRVAPVESAKLLAQMLGADLLLVEGGGHALAQAVVQINLATREFVDRISGRRRIRTWSNATNRRPRALYLSSPIGLGHVHRDLAIAKEMRLLRPDLHIEWLAQPPVTHVLLDHKQHVHPASDYLAAELAAFEQGCQQHGLNAFEAFRRTDDVQVTNFHVFDDVVSEGDYDVIIADEAWEVDLLLHANPERKRAPFVWLTDIIGVVAAPGVPAEDLPLIHDTNAQMVFNRARYPRLRDLSLFVGNPADLTDDPFGPGLPTMRDWATETFDFTGYVLGAPPMTDDDKHAARGRYGYRDDEQVCIVTAGGSAAGQDLLRAVTAAYPQLKKTVPGLRLIAVTGPRVAAAALEAPDGVEVHEYLPQLSDRLGACDVAIVQGGLATCMELTANRTPFVYVPLQQHFEQQVLVPKRLANYAAGHRLDWANVNPDTLSAMLPELLAQPPQHKPVEPDGAARAAEAIARLVGVG